MKADVRRELSAKQKRILEFIRQFVAEHDYPPSIRQIQEACQISSTSVVDYNLRILERLGYIRRDREVSRAIEILERAGLRRSRVVAVPIIGTIAAGQPIPVPNPDTWTAFSDDVIELSPDIVGHRDNIYALRVKGNSMIDALVNDGDIVVMEAASSADDGEMVAAWLKREQETTLKKLYRQGRRVRLQPANQTMQPIVTEAENVDVQGRVITVIRSMR